MKIYRHTKGSALVSVIVITMALALAIASVLLWSGSEIKLTERNTRWMEARNAAEALTEYGFAQVRNQFNSHASPPSFDPRGSNALTTPPANFWQNSHITYSNAELISGDPTGGALTYIDPNNLNNQFDPLKGQWVYRRDVEVLASATATTRDGGAPITAYVTEKVTVRGAPLFANAIFYSNNDLEIFPGPQMDIYGPVHCNGNIFVSNQSNSTGLTFHGPVSCTGNIYHAWASSVAAAQGSGSELLGQNPVKFVNALGQAINMNSTGTATGWKDSSMGADNGVSGQSALANLVTAQVSSQFSQYAEQTWGGNLLTGSMGIQAYNPISYNLPISVDGSGNPIYADPHSIIEAPTPPASSDPYYAGKAQVEQEKFSTQSGLYVRVVVTEGAAGSASSATIQLYGPPGSAAAAGITDASDPTFSHHWKNGGVLLTNPTNMGTANPLLKFNPYRATIVTVGGRGTGGASSSQYPITTKTVTSGGALTATSYSSSNPGSSKDVASGMYDERQATTSDPNYTNGATDLVELDIGVLRAAVNTMVSGTATGDTIKNPDGTVWTGWNGGVYVDITQKTGSGTDITNTAQQTAGVRVTNGEIASGQSLMPNYGTNGNGLTIATNAPLYVLGSYNTNNAVTASSSTTPDDGHTGAASDASAESPVCLAADAITLLSKGWSDANSISLKPTASADTEVAAAFITGLVATGDPNGAGTNANSGGAHNLPRFLEDWNGKTVAIRGSLVCLYSSKIATGQWSTRYYGAPTRSWGFDSIFANGHFPPLTPKVISYRRVAFNNLSATDYAAHKHALWPSYY